MAGEDIYHSGTKGMTKGVRLYQNLDRTWTEAGKIRYGRNGGSKARQKLSNILAKIGKKEITPKSADAINDAIKVSKENGDRGLGELSSRLSDAVIKGENIEKTLKSFNSEHKDKDSGEGKKFTDSIVKNLGISGKQEEKKDEPVKEDKPKRDSWSSDDALSISDQELADRIARLTKENTYKKLLSEIEGVRYTNNPQVQVSVQKKDKGKIGKIIKSASETAVESVARTLALNFAQRAIANVISSDPKRAEKMKASAKAWRELFGGEKSEDGKKDEQKSGDGKQTTKKAKDKNDFPEAELKVARQLIGVVSRDRMANIGGNRISQRIDPRDKKYKVYRPK